MAGWPGGARGALCLSFDNLGVDENSSAAQALPGLLGRLGDHGLPATFFVEGVNAEIAPAALHEISAAGHEVGYHAWRHEQWGELSAAEQAQNLARGVEAFQAIGLNPDGLRPPGGQLGPGGTGVLREAGLHYCSPAGEGAGVIGGVALLPFQWRHVDASCVLPGLGPVREQMARSPDPIDPAAFLAYLEGELERLAREGGFATLVLHLPMFDWWGEERLGALVSRIAETSRRGEVWLAPCAEIAEHVLTNAGAFENGSTLDPTSWDG